MLIDFLLFGQWIFFYYRNKKPAPLDTSGPNVILIKDSNNNDLSETESTYDSEQQPIKVYVVLFAGLCFFSSSLLRHSSSSAAVGYASRTLLSISKREETAVNGVGLAFAWISACLYLGSRAPQIVKNFQRKSTEGDVCVVSFCLFMFVCNRVGCDDVCLCSYGKCDLRNISVVAKFCLGRYLAKHFSLHSGINWNVGNCPFVFRFLCH